MSWHFTQKAATTKAEKTGGDFDARGSVREYLRPEGVSYRICLRKLGAESFGGAGFGFCRFFLAILWRGSGFERLQKPGGCRRNFIDGGEERGFVGLGWLVDAGDFSHEL